MQIEQLPITCVTDYLLKIIQVEKVMLRTLHDQAGDLHSSPLSKTPLTSCLTLGEFSEP